MLDDVGDVDEAPIDAGVLERTVEQFSGGADEGMAGDVLGVSRLLADEHDARALRSFAKYRLRAALVEVARLAARRHVARAVERQALGQQAPTPARRASAAAS